MDTGRTVRAIDLSVNADSHDRFLEGEYEDSPRSAPTDVVDYKPNNNDEWDDLESFDEQVRKEEEESVDASIEIQSLRRRSRVYLLRSS